MANRHGGQTMAQMGLFDLSDRYASLDAKRDPLVEIDAIVPWEEFRPALERVWRKPDEARKSRAGRKPWTRWFGPFTRTGGVRGLTGQDAGAERARQPLRRPDRIPGARSAVGQDGFSGSVSGSISRTGCRMVRRERAIDGVDGSRLRHRNVPQWRTSLRVTSRMITWLLVDLRFSWQDLF